MNYAAPTRAKETVATSIAITGNVVGVVGTATTVSGLMAAAGVSAATAPVVGWIVAAGLAIAASIVKLVGMIKQRRLREAQAVQVAQQLGIPGAASVPGWLFDALSLQKNQRKVEAQKLQKKMARGGTLGNPMWDIRTKLTILGVLEALDMAQQRQAAGLSPVPPSPELVRGIAARAKRIQTNAELAEYLRYGLILGGLSLIAYGLFSED